MGWALTRSERPPWPNLDICDVFLFRGTAGTVLAATANRWPGAGGFHEGGQYGFHVDLDGDFRPDLTFRVTFGCGPGGAQAVEVRCLRDPGAADRDAPGTLIAEGTTGRLIEAAGGLRVWAGRAGDPAWMHGGILDAAQRCIADGEPFDTGFGIRWPSMNLLGYGNVSAIVLEVPDDMIASARIGLWVTTAVPAGGGWVPASRAALPLLATLFPLGAEMTGVDFNASQPLHDRLLFGQAVRDGAAKAARALGSASDPGAHGTWITEVMLPDVLTYRPGTRADFTSGNGRGLRDPAAETVISLVLGTHVPLGIGAGSATGALRALFPYLSAPCTIDPAFMLRQCAPTTWKPCSELP